jgi:hypothetical protein
MAVNGFDKEAPIDPAKPVPIRWQKQLYEDDKKLTGLSLSTLTMHEKLEFVSKIYILYIYTNILPCCIF